MQEEHAMRAKHHQQFLIFLFFYRTRRRTAPSYILERNKKPYKKEILLGKSLKAPTQKPEGNYKLEQ